jgi:hypothetical protein
MGTQIFSRNQVIEGNSLNLSYKPNSHCHSGLIQNTSIPQHLLLFQMQPQLKHVCRNAILHAIKELIGA